MVQNEKAEQQLIFALNRLQGVNFNTVADSAASDTIPVNDLERYFSFNLANYAFAVKASHFCEVFVGPAIAPLPNAPEVLMGLFNVRGILVPVYQLHRLLHQSIPVHRTVFCIGKGEHTVGILTDNLPSSVNLPQVNEASTNQIKLTASLPDIVKELIMAEAFENNKNYLLLDGARMAEQLLILSLGQPTPASISKIGNTPVFY